jgi:hypothetical protein
MTSVMAIRVTKGHAGASQGHVGMGPTMKSQQSHFRLGAIHRRAPGSSRKLHRSLSLRPKLFCFLAFLGFFAFNEHKVFYWLRFDLENSNLERNDISWKSEFSNLTRNEDVGENRRKDEGCDGIASMEPKRFSGVDLGVRRRTRLRRGATEEGTAGLHSEPESL